MRTSDWPARPCRLLPGLVIANCVPDVATLLTILGVDGERVPKDERAIGGGGVPRPGRDTRTGRVGPVSPVGVTSPSERRVVTLHRKRHPKVVVCPPVLGHSEDVLDVDGVVDPEKVGESVVAREVEVVEPTKIFGRPFAVKSTDHRAVGASEPGVRDAHVAVVVGGPGEVSVNACHTRRNRQLEKLR